MNAEPVVHRIEFGAVLTSCCQQSRLVLPLADQFTIDNPQWVTCPGRPADELDFRGGDDPHAGYLDEPEAVA